MPLDSSRLTSRVRDLLRSQPGQPGTADHVRPLAERDLPPEARGGPRYVPDDEVTIAPDGATGCVVIDRHFHLDLQYGRHPVGYYAAIVGTLVPALAVLSAEGRHAPAERPMRPGRLRWDADRRLERETRPSRAPRSGPLLFFDLETTGLSGGAGTVAFLVGCGFFEPDGFHTRQYFLSGYEAEHDLLVSLTTLAERFAGVVSFNGRTFDVPLIETRYLFHRLESPFATMPHFDTLPTARRLWRRRATRFDAPEAWGSTRPIGAASCALGSLEEDILGVPRVNDVPGMEIPSRYFQYLRTGDLEPLDAVFEHNRLDLVSLAALTALAMRMAEEGPDRAASAAETLAMGTIYERAGRLDLSDACYARAAAQAAHPRSRPGVEYEALRRLAMSRRRRRQFDAAAEAWQAMLEADLGAEAAREARRALAIHHEHRARNLHEARRIALQALAGETDEAALAALRHRVARLERKLTRSTVG